MFITKRFVFLLLLIAGIITHNLYSQPDNVTLKDTTISTTVLLSAKKTITIGPNCTVTEDGQLSLESGGTITILPEFTLVKGSEFTSTSGVPVGVDGNYFENQDNMTLNQNYPNPFSNSTTISFSIREPGYVRLSITNVYGKEVSLIFYKYFAIGTYNEIFNASNLSSGVYLYKLETSFSVETRKMILAK